MRLRPHRPLPHPHIGYDSPFEGTVSPWDPAYRALIKSEEDLRRYRKITGVSDDTSYPRWLTCNCTDKTTGRRGGAVCWTYESGGAYCLRCGALL